MAVYKFFMTKSSQKNELDMGVDLGVTCIPSGLYQLRHNVFIKACARSEGGTRGHLQF